MLQRWMDGPEFSIDCLSDLDGRCLNAIPRTMIESKGGESIKGMTIKDPELIEFGRLVSEELAFHLARTPVDSLVQVVCEGEEFSIDVFCDLDSRCVNGVPRTMIESKGGESIKGMSLKDEELIAFAARVAEALGLVGPGNVQCFREPDGSLLVTDVNPRFGGGFPLPTAAGSRYPELALALARGERLERRLGEFEPGLVMTRFFSEVILRENAAGQLEPVKEA